MDRLTRNSISRAPYICMCMYIPAALVGVMRVQDVTTRTMQMAAATECTALIVSTLARTVLNYYVSGCKWPDALVLVYIEGNC